LKRKICFLILAAALSGGAALFAQSRKDEKPEHRPAQKKDNLNRTDVRNRKQGLWFYEHDARMGEPHYYEYGSYIDDKKSGVWTKLDTDQRLMSTETYSRGQLNGISQYYEDGRLVCVGNYRGLYADGRYDSIWVTNPETLEDSLVAVPTELGYTKHGLWRYYDAGTGQLTREEEYQVDNLIREQEFSHYTRSDSLAIRKRNDNLPHNKKASARPPAGKRKSLIE